MAKHYKVNLDEITVLGKKYPLLDVFIFGTPSLSEIISLMKEINKLTIDIEEDYISATDMSKMQINTFLRSIIMYGMKSKYKSMISVKNPAKVSFLILGNTIQESKMLKETLASINEVESDQTKEYRYNYVFIKDKEEIAIIAPKFLK